MAEVTYRRIQIVPHDGKFGVVLEWSDTCALTLTRDSLESAFESIRSELARGPTFELIPQAGELPWTT
jgi:hypothetical protein